MGLFDWLKTDKGPIVAEKLANIEPMDTRNMTLVQKIHDDFKTKGDLLIQEANKILGEATFKDLSSKKELLHECGFTNTKITQEVKILEDKIEKSKIITNFTNKLLGQYKVIHTEQILEICSKYKLCMATSNNYQAEVPVKNLKEIKTFFDIYKNQTNTADHNLYRKHACIVAPEKDFNLNTEFLIKKNLKIKLEDPIVLFPCKNYLERDYWGREISNQYFYVVTAWGGPEASDASVVNEKMN